MNTSHSHDEPKQTTESLGDAALDLLRSDAPIAPPPQPAPKTVEASCASAPDAPPVVAKLEGAVAGLLMPSESDEPFRVVYWPLEKAALTDSEVAFYAAEKADAPVETQSVEHFFRNAVTIESWMKDDDRKAAQQFQNLVETLQAELEKPQVYLIGKTERTAAVIGKVEGGFAGVVTTVVET